jgi:transcriptional regulator GlxA family with amidase domain
MFDGVEILDFAGPFEPLAITWDAGEPLFSVLTVAAQKEVITCFGGLKVLPEHGFDDHPALDFVIVPGGHVTEASRDERVLSWIQKQSQTAEIVASVCTGAFILAEAGLLDGGPATTHWAAIDRLTERYPQIDVRSGERVVDRGSVLTAAGISAGIDMALYLIARFHGLDVALETAKGMEYDWDPSLVPAVP